MGREIRMVPPNWEHPKKRAYNPRTNQMEDNYQPMYDRGYHEACKEWYKECSEYTPDGDCQYYHEWAGNPPDEDYHRPDWKDEEQTWIQVYETVSEGTPVTPPFATKEELVDYLVENGDFWDQSRGHGGWSRESAESFVDSGWRPTGIMQGGNVKMARDM